MIRRYPSVGILTAVVLGITAADRLAVPSWVWFVLLLAGAGATVCWMLRQRLALVALSVGVAACALSAFHFSSRYVDSGTDDLGRTASLKEVFRVYGRVSDWPDLRSDRTEIKVAVDSVCGPDARRVRGVLLVKIAEATTALQRGDRVEFQARIYPLPATAGSDFDYGRYLNLRGVRGIVYLPTALSVRVDHCAGFGWFGLVDRLREAISETLQSTLSPQSAALAAGFLIGETRDIPPDVYAMFRDSGTLHLLAVSGSNVALVLVFFLILMRPLGLSYRSRSAVLLGVIVLFAGLCYGEPSVIRASVMAALVIFARLLGRVYDLNNVIGLAALLILVVDPAQLYDVGFQLSFVIAWGLIFIVPRLTPLFRGLHGRWWYRIGIFPLLVVLVAQVCSTPIIAFYFKRIPLISIPANLLVVPAVSAAVLGILVLLFATLVLPLLGAWIGSLVDLWLHLLVHALTLFGGPQMPVIVADPVWSGGTGAALVVMAYVLLALAVWSLSSRTARRLALVVLVLFVNAALSMGLLQTRQDATAELDVQRVPGGTACVIRQPSDQIADLVITGLQRVSYPIDERILEPMLRTGGVERLRRVFVLEADYAALDDVLRLVRRFAADSLFVAGGLRASIDDILREDSLLGADMPAIREFSGRPSSGVSDGYYVSAGLVRLSSHGQHVLFAWDPPDELPADWPLPSQTVLVVGGAWVGDRESGSRPGYATVVCSRIAQPDDKEYEDEELGAHLIPAPDVIDLSRVGRYHLVLRNSLSN
jgi:ComEC/Rec2-related protein